MHFLTSMKAEPHLEDLCAFLRRRAELPKAERDCVIPEYWTGAADHIEALLADKARLDWMQEHAREEGRTMAMPRYTYHVKQWSGDPGPNIRSAIDKEIEQSTELPKA